MRAKEFLRRLNESDGGAGGDTNPGDDGSSTQGSQKKGSRGQLHHHHSTAIPGLTTISDWPGWYYNMYRLGVHLAGSPNNPPAEEGAFANEMTFVTLTDAEEEMIKHSAKEMGVKLNVMSGRESIETDNTNTKSTVAKIKKNKYGI